MASKKKPEPDSKGKLKFSSTLDMKVHDVDPSPESAMQAKETAEEYIAREYGEAIRASNTFRVLEGILVEIVKWRLGK